MLITEQPSHYRHLEKMPIPDIITYINEEDKTVAFAVEKALPQIEKLIEAIADKMLAGGKLFYIGAGTSGRLGILDASECPPTYGVPYDLVQGVIAGGFDAIIRAAEFAEDNTEQGWLDLQSKNISDQDFVVGIAASGTTPYTLGAMRAANTVGAVTIAVANNAHSPLLENARYPILVETGAEVIAGSTRMKAGTAQKVVLNLLSTALMTRMGRVYRGLMVHLRARNTKLKQRGRAIIAEIVGCTDDEAARYLEDAGGDVKSAILLGFGLTVDKAADILERHQGNLRAVLDEIGRHNE